jgi:hydrogenase maturation protease
VYQLFYSFSQSEIGARVMVGKTVVVGIGSPHGDDQIGWRIADRLSQAMGSLVEIYKAASPIELLDLVDRADELTICDACRADSDFGTIRRWNWPTEAIETCRFSGSHDLPLPAALELASQLGRLPRRVTIWGVNIGSTQPMTNLSPEIEAAVLTVTRQILQSNNHA